MKYSKLKIDYEIPEELSNMIDEYVCFLNTGEGIADDYYRTEIQLILNWCYRERKLSNAKIDELRAYYQEGGILRG